MDAQDLQGLAHRLREYIRARGALGGLIPPVMREAADALECLSKEPEVVAEIVIPVQQRGTCNSCRWLDYNARCQPECGNPDAAPYSLESSRLETWGCHLYDHQPTATEEAPNHGT